MRQRVMIALSLLHEPELVIADEPTTALDVLVQDQILGEIDALRERMGLSLILISHDMGAVAETCSRVAVMYAGEIVELAPTETIFESACHPYTQALLAALPTVTGPRRPLRSIPGRGGFADAGRCRLPFRTTLPQGPGGLPHDPAAPNRPVARARGAVPLPRTGCAIMSAPLLALAGLAKHYPIRAGWLDTLRGKAPAALRAVDSIDLRIEAGEIVALGRRVRVGQDDDREAHHPAGTADRRFPALRRCRGLEPARPCAHRLSAPCADDLSEPLRGARPPLHDREGGDRAARDPWHRQ